MTEDKLITGILILGDAMKHPLKECIESYLPWIDSLMIYDGSGDGSKDFILSMLPVGVEVEIIEENPPMDFGRWRNECMEAIHTEWGLFFFTDEILEAKDNFTPKDFRELLMATEEDWYRIPRYNEPDGVSYPDWQTNIIRKGGSRHFNGKVHEKLVPDPREVHLEKLLIRHRPLGSWERRV